MFKHLLLPTDGSALAGKAVAKGFGLAKSLGARVTLLSVVPEFQMVADESFAVPMSAQLKIRYEKEAAARATGALQKLQQKAAKTGIKADVVVLVGDLPYRQIIATARKRKCDAVVMASHGRRGLTGLLLGSETVKVLTHSKIPVLVVR
ncbi:MAG: universal stress protein [Burkholderiales bacterium]|nr:universal stress protein [Burkholderiales bacterium]MCW5603800.1 universal stress protein [Burkholderiales bacterium]